MGHVSQKQYIEHKDVKIRVVQVIAKNLEVVYILLQRGDRSVL